MKSPAVIGIVAAALIGAVGAVVMLTMMDEKPSASSPEAQMNVTAPQPRKAPIKHHRERSSARKERLMPQIERPTEPSAEAVVTNSAASDEVKAKEEMEERRRQFHEMHKRGREASHRLREHASRTVTDEEREEMHAEMGRHMEAMRQMIENHLSRLSPEEREQVEADMQMTGPMVGAMMLMGPPPGMDGAGGAQGSGGMPGPPPGE